MKKRNLALLLALTMVAASFVGCGDKKEKASDNGSVKQEAEDEGSEEGRYLMILSILVDTFSSRILNPMLLPSGKRNIVVF